MQSLSLNTEKPLSPDKFFPWMQKLVAEDGPSILRCKGILSFKDDPDRFVLQGVHMILDGDHQRPWKPDEKRLSRWCSSARTAGRKKSVRGLKAAWRDCMPLTRLPPGLMLRSPQSGRLEARGRPSFETRPLGISQDEAEQHHD